MKVVILVVLVMDLFRFVHADFKLCMDNYRREVREWYFGIFGVIKLTELYLSKIGILICK